MIDFNTTTPSPRVSCLGILDADLGGLPLVAQIRARWPAVAVFYLADTAHSPIGERSPGLIGRRLRAGLAYLRDQGAENVVLASQSMAALAVEASGEPDTAAWINPLYPSAAAAADGSRSGRIGVIGSSATVASGAYPHAIHARRPKAAVHCVAAPLLVPLLDAAWYKKPETRMIVKKYLHGLKVRQVDTLIMAGSRYAALADLMGRKIGRAVRLVDPMACLVAVLERCLTAGPVPQSVENRCRLWVTDSSPAVQRSAQALLKRRGALDEIRL